MEKVSMILCYTSQELIATHYIKQGLSSLESGTSDIINIWFSLMNIDFCYTLFYLYDTSG